MTTFTRTNFTTRLRTWILIAGLTAAASSPATAAAATTAAASGSAVDGLGVPLEDDTHSWYGEPAKATRGEFYRQARLMRLDGA